MQWLVEVGLSNALAVVVLAIVACVAGKISRRPAVTHALWLLVLLKLLTPPIIELPLPWSIARIAVSDPAIVDRTDQRAAALPIERESKREQESATPNDGGNFFAAHSSKKSRLVIRTVEPQFSAAADTTSTPAARTATDTASSDLEPGSLGAAIAPAATGETFQPHSESWRRFGQFAAMVWCIGLIAWIVLQVVLGLRLPAILQASAPAPVELCKVAAEIARRMGLRRRPQVRIVAANVSPMLCGLGRGATILIPAALLSRLSQEAQATVLAHELAHFRRGDQWVRLVELVVTGLYWWHPVVWWARRQIEIAEEQCCDAHVVEMSAGKSRVYAEALLDIVDLISEPPRQVRPAMSSGIGQRPLLQKRLVDLMKRRCVPTMTSGARRVIVVAGAVSLACHPALFVTEPPQVQAATANAIAEVAQRTLAELNESRSASPSETQIAAEPSELQRLPDSPSPSRTEVEPKVEEYEWATAISPNGRFHITVRRGYECELREVTSDQVRSLSGHRITCVAFTADSARFVTGDLRGKVLLWDSATGEVLQTLTQREGPLHSVCLMSSGEHAVVAGHDGVVELVSMTSPNNRQVVAHLDAPVRCARFSPDGSRLVIVMDTWKDSVVGAVAVYDVGSRTRLLQWEVTGPLGAIDFPSQDRLVTVEWSGRVREWTLPGLVAENLPPIAKELVSAASFSVDSRVLEDLQRHTNGTF